eukprot:GHVS01061444.1.p1 GENE.GHVS01061444.1~~GHVS01061444.1.p1  ORF type:complete len:183 (+),score=20.02 GHVS01061444.1:119-667(+)
MEEVLDELSRAVSGGGGDVSEDQLHEAYRTVSKLCTNILKNRTEKKYRTIKKSNGSIRSKLLLDSKPPLCDLLTKLLEELGFTDLEDSFVFVSDDAEAFENLCHNADILQGIMASLDIAPVHIHLSNNVLLMERFGKEEGQRAKKISQLRLCERRRQTTASRGVSSVPTTMCIRRRRTMLGT